MKNLKRLAAAVVLTCAFGLSALAGEVETPPCAPPAPGETSSPPCSGSLAAPDDPAAPGQTDTPPASTAAEATALALSLFESLSLF